MSKISVVVPLFNESESLVELHDELVRACEGRDAEFIFVDDGSQDASWSVVAKLAQADPRVSGIRLRRNFGKASALTAGFRQATGDVVITMDGDLQDNPAEISRFLESIASGLDVVSGWKQTRHDPWHKVLPSRLFNWAVSTLTECHLHDHNCGFKAYRREVLAEVQIYGELHRFVPALAHGRGFRVGELVVNHRARKFGKSKYGITRLVKGLLDLVTVRFLTRFRQRPLHVLGAFGLTFAFVGGIGLTAIFAAWVAGRSAMIGPVLTMGSVMLLGLGVQLFIAGLLAEMITSYNLRPDLMYSVAETIASRVSSEEGRPSHV